MKGPCQPTAAEDDDDSSSDEDEEMRTQPTALEQVISALEEVHSVLEENKGATIPEDVSLKIVCTYTALFDLFADMRWSNLHTSALSIHTLFEHME